MLLVSLLLAAAPQVAADEDVQRPASAAPGQEAPPAQASGQDPADGSEQAPADARASGQEPGDQEKEKSRDSARRGDDGPRWRGSPEERERARAWWNSLSEDEKERVRERWSRLREMRPEAREELERRAEFVREQTAEMLAEMTAEERARIEKLPSAERDRVLRDRLRARLENRADAMRERGFDGPPPDKRRDFEERLNWSREQREEFRIKRVARDLDRAVEDGWLGEKAAAQLRTMPLETAERVLGRVHQWRTIDWMDRRGRWEELGINPEGRARLAALEPPAFFDELRKRMRDQYGDRGRRGWRDRDGDGRGRDGDGRGRDEDGKGHPRGDDRDGRRDHDGERPDRSGSSGGRPVPPADEPDGGGRCCERA